MKLNGIREQVFLDRYSLKDEKGKPVEKTPEAMWKRVAAGVAAVEKKADRKHWEKKFNEAMNDFKLVPGGRILSGAGTGYKVTFYNCFVIPSPKDSRDGILDTLKQMDNGTGRRSRHQFFITQAQGGPRQKSQRIFFRSL